jgi:glycosyltransferase involved in cell wall biosynthesis
MESDAAAMKNLIIIPAHNEEESLPGVVASLQVLSDDFELLVVNDGSRDGTAALAERLAAGSRLPMHVVSLAQNWGIGVAVQTGYLFAARSGRYDYAIQFDGDGQHDAAAIPALIDACRRSSLDLCIGSRFLAPRTGSFQSTFMRRVGIRFFSKLIRLLSGVRVTDPTSGLRCAGARVWRRFAERYPDDYPEPESLFWCARNRLRIGEVPVRMFERQGGVSSIRTVRAVYYMLKVSSAIVLEWLRARECDRT